MLESIDGPFELISDPSLESIYGIGVYFTCRKGGASEGNYHSMNLSFNVNDERVAVANNRKALADVVGVPVNRWTLCRQVHGCRIHVMEEYDIGRGAYDHESGIPRSDGLVSDLSGTLIGVLTADCVPVIIVAKRKRVCAAVHAGWRGVLAGVLPKAYKNVQMKTGENNGDIDIYIGPHIRSCCFEVQKELGGMFESYIGIEAVDRSLGNCSYIDLEASIVSQLEREGAVRENIHSMKRCTFCEENYFSHRKDGGLTGRQAGIAVIH
ncbi:MAG: peptidoglycan editing factor PgeF [Actinobacteria bacterium]|nr:peptidoglycan editing factor PgeF [Actinomycetota bacterium]